MERQTVAPEMEPLVLVSHPLCPYVQRAAIVLLEKGVPFERRDVDLACKPAWFLDVSPLGKTPVLLAGGEAISESAVICEYLDETLQPPLHPHDVLQRARHRAWMEFGSAVLGAIGAFAPDEPALAARRLTCVRASRKWRPRWATVRGSPGRTLGWGTRCSGRCSGTSTC